MIGAVVTTSAIVFLSYMFWLMKLENRIHSSSLLCSAENEKLIGYIDAQENRRGDMEGHPLLSKENGVLPLLSLMRFYCRIWRVLGAKTLDFLEFASNSITTPRIKSETQ